MSKNSLMLIKKNWKMLNTYNLCVRYNINCYFEDYNILWISKRKFHHFNQSFHELVP